MTPGEQQGGRFGTAVLCIDGRVHGPVCDWMKRRFGLDYVDLVTMPGADGRVARKRPEDLAHIRSAVEVSFRAHRSRVVVLAGHRGCAANAVPPRDHRRDIEGSVDVLSSWGLGADVVGLWVEGGRVEVVKAAPWPWKAP